MAYKQAVISLSGGMDSSTLLLRLLTDRYEVTAISFDYGQKHRVELERAQSLVNYLNTQLPAIGYPVIKYKVIKLDGLGELLHSTLVTGGAEVPEGHYAEENMKDTVVPNRNKIFSSIIQAIALSIANTKNTTCKIALGIHSGDATIYPDCRQEFRDADMLTFRLGNWNAEKVEYLTPYLHVHKFDILRDGEKCCEALHLDFDEVYRRTNTSYKPYPSGNSDYKSASSVERIEAFIKLGTKDPVQYEDETGPVNWEVAVNHVKSLLLARESS
jgi:7-cyano-7-deazaguanine synthase